MCMEEATIRKMAAQVVLSEDIASISALLVACDSGTGREPRHLRFFSYLQLQQFQANTEASCEITYPMVFLMNGVL